MGRARRPDRAGHARGLVCHRRLLALQVASGTPVIAPTSMERSSRSPISRSAAPCCSRSRSDSRCIAHGDSCSPLGARRVTTMPRLGQARWTSRARAVVCGLHRSRGEGAARRGLVGRRGGGQRTARGRRPDARLAWRSGHPPARRYRGDRRWALACQQVRDAEVRRRPRPRWSSASCACRRHLARGRRYLARGAVFGLAGWFLVQRR